jgi:hypothetical protein
MFTFIQLAHRQIEAYIKQTAIARDNDLKHPDFKIALVIRESLVLLLRTMMQVVYENVNRIPFIDIAFAISFIDNWVTDTISTEGFITEELIGKNLKKVNKLLLKIQELVVLTNPRLYTGGPPTQLAIIAVMTSFHDHQVGSQEFWDKCFVLLSNILKQDEKVWRPLEASHLIKLLSILVNHDKKINNVLSKQKDDKMDPNELVWK